jgi:hypothetical protein
MAYVAIGEAIHAIVRRSELITRRNPVSFRHNPR